MASQNLYLIEIAEVFMKNTCCFSAACSIYAMPHRSLIRHTCISRRTWRNEIFWPILETISAKSPLSDFSLRQFSFFSLNAIPIAIFYIWPNGWNFTTRVTGLPWYEENGKDLLHPGFSDTRQLSTLSLISWPLLHPSSNLRPNYSTIRRVWTWQKVLVSIICCSRSGFKVQG